jgi:hypothetical protein
MKPRFRPEQMVTSKSLLAFSRFSKPPEIPIIAAAYPTDVDSFGRPIDAVWAAPRDRNERLVEIKQIKGQSETHPLLSPNDEFANYEITIFLIGMPSQSGRIPHIVGSYARQALKDGLTMQDTNGYNPYKFGFVGGSDSHNTGVPYRQNNFYGGHGINDGTIETPHGRPHLQWSDISCRGSGAPTRHCWSFSPKKRILICGPLVPKVSLRYMASQREARVFSSAHTPGQSGRVLVTHVSTSRCW